MKAPSKLEPASRAPSKVGTLAVLYGRAATLEQQMVEAAQGKPVLGDICAAMPLAEIAAATMHTPPASMEDLALTIGIAASFIDYVTDDLAEGSPQHRIGLAIGSALENATLLLSRREGLSLQGEALDLFTMLIADVVRAGAEIVEERP